MCIKITQTIKHIVLFNLNEIAERMNLLGSETAFAVPAEAAKMAATGKNISFSFGRHQFTYTKDDY